MSASVCFGPSRDYGKWLGYYVCKCVKRNEQPEMVELEKNNFKFNLFYLSHHPPVCCHILVVVVVVVGGADCVPH